jgi:hypothetical protein
MQTITIKTKAHKSEKEVPEAFFRGLVIAVPISLALWGAILWALWAMIG